MAKNTVNKRANIYINTEGDPGSLKVLKKEASALRREIQLLKPGTDAFILKNRMTLKR
jgi:hypothetical protein